MFFLNAVFILAAFVLSSLIVIWIESGYTEVGESFGMHLMRPFLIIFIMALFFGLYQAIAWVFNRNKHTAEQAQAECSYSDDVNDDLYLVKQKINEDLIDYQISNKEKAVLWKSRCALKQGKLDSIILTGEAGDEIVWQRNAQGDLSVENQSALGTLKVTPEGLIFSKHGEARYTALPEDIDDEGLGAAAEWLLSIALVSSVQASDQADCFIIKDQDDQALGKYYSLLNNIDLSVATNHHFDRRVIVLMAILLDSEVKQLA